MRSARKLFAFCCVSTLLVLFSTNAAGAKGQNTDDDGNKHDDAKHNVRVLASELSSPKGLAATADNELVVGQGAFGPPGPVLLFPLHGKNKGEPQAVTDVIGLVDVAISPLDGSGWGIGPDEAGEGHLYHQLADGTVVDVLNIAAYQAEDPDLVDIDMPPNPMESNPYGLTVMRNGDALIADAAGNDVIRVTPDGIATTVARFDLQKIATDHLPPDFPGGPLPPILDAESVPTTVAIGPDGAIYVGELKGFPFRPGTSLIWRIEADATDALCSVNTPDPTNNCSLFSEGFTAIQDIAFDRRSGRMYVYELAADGVLAFEAALDPASGAPFPAAVLLEVKLGGSHDRRTELAAGQLSQPGGVVVVGGKVYVTDGVFTDGRLLRIPRNDSDGHGHDDDSPKDDS